MNQPIFTAEQEQYLASKLTGGKALLDAAKVMLAKTPTSETVNIICTMFVSNGLPAGDAQAVKEEIVAKLSTPATGFPRVGGQQVAFASLGASVVAPTVSIVEAVARLLSSTSRDGQREFKKALAKMYREDTSKWPTVDAFGRPFPSLVQLTNGSMTKEVVKQYFTNSGYPKCHLDGLSYYVQDKAGYSLYLLAQVAAQEAADSAREGRPVKVDMATVPVDIQAGDWRWWNGSLGQAARYARPDQHEQTCAMQGILPSEYRALIAAQSRPSTTAAPAATPKRSRTRK